MRHAALCLGILMISLPLAFAESEATKHAHVVNSEQIDLRMVKSCDLSTSYCKLVLEKLNEQVLANPQKPIPEIQFYNAQSLLDVLPEKTWRIYSLFHPAFYYGQKVPVDQKIAICHGCSIEDALELEDKLRLKIVLLQAF